PQPLYSLHALHPPLLFPFHTPATTEIYTLSLHDALPICRGHRGQYRHRPRSRLQCARLPLRHRHARQPVAGEVRAARDARCRGPDRKSTRLNSSHVSISYAVFCLKKKKKDHILAAAVGRAVYAQLAELGEVALDLDSHRL